ncbi:hypothetical protein [Nostoc sp. FACHB-888]|uniref:hypothetical protein n=1 Tax=Nostoc sp. FACHB-888 TaxID=2692842 RepID=UPI001686E398|nr:hypothetical protein [Nostoc sp. FACHB-888]MBD2246819.1 hypothetical protein [Nostoc sp. FACHB-888]
MMIAPAIAVKITRVLHNGFMLRHLLLQETTILFCTEHLLAIVFSSYVKSEQQPVTVELDVAS